MRPSPANPFKPGKPLICPELFAGRTTQLSDGLGLLKQAAAGNVRHGAITGSSGIGKSSLCWQLIGAATGEARFTPTLAAIGIGRPFVFPVAIYQCRLGDDAESLGAGLIEALEETLGMKRPSVAWEVSLDFKVLKTQFSSSPTPTAMTKAFIRTMGVAWEKLAGQVDGLLLVVDDLELIAKTAGVGAFLRNVTEGLVASGLENVLLLLVGQTGFLQHLQIDHRSIPRVFEPIRLPLLTPDEVAEATRRALAPTAVGIDEAGLTEMGDRAEGLPARVHLIGYHAFEQAASDVIGRADIRRGLEILVSDKMQDEFAHRLLSAGAGRYQHILFRMASESSPVVPTSRICSALALDSNQISRYMRGLAERGIVVRVNRGVWAIRDGLYRLYLRHRLGLSGWLSATDAAAEASHPLPPRPKGE